nr:hypothetical protein [Staphylococcus auricularis]
MGRERDLGEVEFEDVGVFWVGVEGGWVGEIGIGDGEGGVLIVVVGFFVEVIVWGWVVFGDHEIWEKV